MSGDDLKDVIPTWDRATYDKVQALKASNAKKVQEDVIRFAAKHAAAALTLFSKIPTLAT